MAQQQEPPANEIGFQQIELLKDQSLGVGSYGSVCKAICDNIVCAAKIIHPTLVPPYASHTISPEGRHRLPMSRFETECDFLRDIRHPNIVQFLGMHTDPQTGLPVLLMELMDESLTHFLESSAQPIPYHVQVAITLDIIGALFFLHSNGIIHRDLSSNNILIIGHGVRAKLTDFGMAKLISVSFTRVSNTVCPGTDVYMPPEAVDNQAVYNEKGDIFSFGVNIIQILTKKFPKPGDRSKTVFSSDPQFSYGKIRVFVSEVERRNNHISEVNPAHPLLAIALDCLKDQEGEQPSAAELCERVAALRDAAEYRESEGRQGTEQTVIPELRQQLQQSQQAKQKITVERDQLRQQYQHFQQVLAANQQELAANRQVLAANQQEIRDLRDQLRVSQSRQRDGEEMIEQFKRRIEEIELTFRLKPQAQPSTTATPQSSRSDQPARGPPATSSGGGVSRLTSTLRGRAPCKMFSVTDAVVNGDVAYFRPALSREVYSYRSGTETWSQLPDCPTVNSTLSIVNGQLTTVGGINSNKLYNLTTGRKWLEEFPAMPTSREGVVVVCTGQALIVAGGFSRGKLTTVEVMNTDTRQWSTAADLPQPTCGESATVCGDRIYTISSYSVIACSLPALLETCQPKIFEAQSSTPQGHLWCTVTKLRVELSTLVTLNNRVLAIGGCDSDGNTTKDVCMYDPVNNNWQSISHLATARWRCFAVVLQGNIVLIVGGRTTRYFDNGTDTVESLAS